jgi:HSP20 family molecular chaperone IbpA
MDLHIVRQLPEFREKEIVVCKDRSQITLTGSSERESVSSLQKKVHGQFRIPKPDIE